MISQTDVSRINRAWNSLIVTESQARQHPSASALTNAWPELERVDKEEV